MPESLIGAALPRLEDRRLLMGQAGYLADVTMPGMLHLAVVRSQHAHGRLRAVDLARARAVPGVVDAFCAADIPGYLDPIPVRLGNRQGLDPFLQPPLATNRVRYIGEPVAVVIAEDRYSAEDGAEMVEMEIDPLPAHAGVDAALAQGAVPLFDGQSNLAREIVTAKGDVDAAFAAAAFIVEDDFATGRHSGVPMETRGVLASWDSGRGALSVWGATKVPHFNRMILSRLLRLAEARVHLFENEVGGGFGVRGEIYPEDILVPLASMRLRRPVRWIEDRLEHMIAANQSRQQQWWARVGLSEDGRILALDAQVSNDMGAYMRTHGLTVPSNSTAIFIGPYEVPNYRCAMRCVMTNKTPTGTYRAPGRFEADFVRERLLDVAARRAGLDRAALRRRNFVPREAMPHDTGLAVNNEHVIYDSGDFAETFGIALERSRYQTLEDRSERERGASRRIGIGFAPYVERTGNGPAETVRLALDGSGSVRLATGASSLGQGHETTFAQVCAETLGAEIERVYVEPVDTDLVNSGGGTFSSRGAVVACGAIHRAALLLRQRVLEAAAARWEVPVESLEIQAGWVIHAGSGGRIEMGALASSETPYVPTNPGFSVEASYQPEKLPYTYGTQCATVEVDTGTGKVRVLRYVIVADVGRVINPTVVDGQLRGAAAQGIGGALLEEFVYDEQAQPLATTFMDYLVPTAAEIPDIECVALGNYPSPHTPLGVKGVGQSGIAGTGAAIANAVADALGENGDAIRHLPITPERVLRAIEG
jgi:aerobic carbon-monoxide dehydrogenase large subunit